MPSVSEVIDPVPCDKGTRPHSHIGKCGICGKFEIVIKQWGNRVHDDRSICQRSEVKDA